MARMGIHVFDTQIANRVTQSMPLRNLNGSVIAVDAIYYLENLLAAHKEPLLSALGGFPLALEAKIVKELGEIQSAGTKLHFVFNGLDWGVKDDPFAASIASARANVTAFDIYERDQAKEAISVFRDSGHPSPFDTAQLIISDLTTYLGAPTPAALVPFLKKVLHENECPFTVAPYSAFAQLVYFEKHPSQFIDAVYGPSELFVFGIDKIITKFDLVHTAQDVSDKGHSDKAMRLDPDASLFRWIDRRVCLEHLGHIPVEVFENACLLAGSSLLKPFPPLCNPASYPKGYTLREVVNLITSHGRSVVRLCSQYSNDPLVRELEYLDRYKRTMSGIKHHPVITSDGDVEILDKEHAPDDIHACVGYQLPEELTMYLSRGMIRPGFLGALNSGLVRLTAPLDGGDSPIYQKLVKTQLRPIREQTFALLASALHHYYKNAQTICTKFWFEPENEQKTMIKSIVPFSEDLLAQWNVRGEIMIEQRRKLGAASENLVPGSLSFAIQSLADNSFAEKTITAKSKDEDKLLRTRHEITANAVWRFLQLRGYVNEKHQLTSWGEVLKSALLKVGSSKDQEEAVFLAVELLRLDLLNADTMFAGYSGAPVRGSSIDKRNCMLVSRIASLGKLQHHSKGYRGPLSRHLLAYRSIVFALHSALRDLLEISLVTMFLRGHVERSRDDWMDLALGLPLYEDHSCALGVVVMSYLDELNAKEDPTDAQTREKQQNTAQGWVPNCDFIASLNDALQLWDAIYSAVNKAGDAIKDKSMWDEVNVWLAARR